MAESVQTTDRDLASIGEARAMAQRAKQAWLELAEFSQERIDAIVGAMAEAATAHAEAFARLAASSSTSATLVMHLTAAGCGLMTIEHRALSAIRIL